MTNLIAILIILGIIIILTGLIAVIALLYYLFKEVL